MLIFSLTTASVLAATTATCDVPASDANNSPRSEEDQPAQDEPPYYYPPVPTDVAGELVRLLGQNVVADAKFRGLLYGSPGQVRFRVDTLMNHRFQGQPGTDEWEAGYIVEVQADNPTLARAGTSRPTWAVQGTIRMRTPGERAAAVDFLVHVTPTDDLSADWQPRMYPVEGSVRWSNVRPIPPESVALPQTRPAPATRMTTRPATQPVDFAVARPTEFDTHVYLPASPALTIELLERYGQNPVDYSKMAVAVIFFEEGPQAEAHVHLWPEITSTFLDDGRRSQAEV